MRRRRTHLTAHPVTTCSKFPKSPPWFLDLSSKCALCELVATAAGTPEARRCSTSLVAPGIALVCGKRVASTSSRRRTNSAASTLNLFWRSRASTSTRPAASDVRPIIFALSSQVKAAPSPGSMASRTRRCASVYALSVSRSRPSMSKRTWVMAAAEAARGAAAGSPAALGVIAEVEEKGRGRS